MAAPATSTQRWFCLTPDRLILGLLAVECLLFLSERFHCFAFNMHKGWTVLIAVASVGAAMLLMFVWFAVSLVFRWRFQFSIRSLLVLTLAVAIPCSWLSWEMKKAGEQKEAAQEIRKLALGYVEYDHAGQQAGNPRVVPPGLAWLWNLLGEDFFATIVRVRTFFVTDAFLGRMKGLTQIEWLVLSGSGVSDAGLDDLKGLTKLRTLSLNCGEVTNTGLEHLAGLAKLQTLVLHSARISDAGLRHLKGLTQLQELGLRGTNVTDEGVKRLQQALPWCEINVGRLFP
jgi:hypothetical protein